MKQKFPPKTVARGPRLGSLKFTAWRGKREIHLTEGADDTVFGGGAGIHGQRHTRTSSEVVRIAVVLTQIVGPSRLIVRGAVERGVDAHVTTQLDAGVGARDVEESGTIQGAYLHVLDRFGLDGKIGCLRPRPWRANPPLSRG